MLYQRDKNVYKGIIEKESVHNTYLEKDFLPENLKMY